MRLPRNLKVFRGQLEAAPFLSVLLLLLILLALTPKLVFDPGAPVHVELARSDTRLPGITNATLSVAIDSSGLYYYEGRVTPLPSLLAELKTAAASSPTRLALRIFADKTVRYDAIEQLSSEAGKLGFPDVFLVSAPPLEVKSAPASMTRPRTSPP